MQPLIGLTMYGRIERPVPSEHYEEHYSVPVVFVEAIRRAGGVPILLPPGEAHTDRWLDGLDGVVIAGGTDIDPGRYGKDRTPAVLMADPELILLDEPTAGINPTLIRHLVMLLKRPRTKLGIIGFNHFGYSQDIQTTGSQFILI